MGKKKRILFAVLILAVLGVLAWEVFRVREPVYEGKTLSEWLSGYDYASGDTVEDYEKHGRESDEAVRHIGTNALPFLEKMYTAKDSKLKKKLIALAGKQSLIKFKFTTASDLKSQASSGIYVLGQKAKPLIPMVIRSLGDPEPHATFRAAQILAKIGFEGLAPLTNALTSTNITIRACAIYALGNYREPENDGLEVSPLSKEELTSAQSIIIPILLQLLNDSDRMIRDDAAGSLEMIHQRPEIVIPQLIRYSSTSNDLQLGFPYWLEKFGTSARTAIPAILKMLEDPNERTRSVATEVLKKIDPAAAAKAGVK